jgi:hypothetical protein
MNRRAREPFTPALRALRGATPLLYLSRTTESNAVAEPAYAVAVFDDGTFVYEGHRCVKLGGVTLGKLAPDELVQLKGVLLSRCHELPGIDDAELCGDATTLHVFCADFAEVQSGSDHCRKGDAVGHRLEGLRSDVIDRLGLDAAIGAPPERQSCEPTSPDLAPHELARVLSTSLAADLIRV